MLAMQWASIVRQAAAAVGVVIAIQATPLAARAREIAYSGEIPDIERG